MKLVAVIETDMSYESLTEASYYAFSTEPRCICNITH